VLCARVGALGVMARETSVAAVTVSVDEPVTLPNVAVRVEGPTLAPVARPLDPPALLTTAAAFDALHVTAVVRS
jgi:hypothetical protein